MRQPCPPAYWTGCLHTRLASGGRHGALPSRAADHRRRPRTYRRTWSGNSPNVDRLLEVAGEPGGEEPVVVALERAATSARRRGSAPFAPRPRASARRPCRPCPGAGGPSGSRPAAARSASAIPSAPVAASSVRNPAARSTSRASFRFLSLSSTIRTSGWRPDRRRVRRAWRCTTSPAVSSPHADPARARRGPLPRPRGPSAPARDAARDRGRGGLRRPRLAARGGRRRAARRRRHRHPHAAGRHRRGDPGRRAAARDEPGGRRRRPQPVREPELRRSRSSRAAARGAPTS